jgi:hypothetical protein
MDLLEFDLNEVVSKAVSAKIADLEKQVSDHSQQTSNYHNEISKLKKQVRDAKLTLAFITMLRDEFAAIESDPREPNDYQKYKSQKQYLYIEELMKVLFNKLPENGGWHSSRGEGNLKSYLAVNFYSSKDILLSILPLILPDDKTAEIISFIKDFKMPYDWDKSQVLTFVKNPGTCTNGSYIGISNFWIERGAGTNNCPYNLVMMNKQFLDEDVLEVVFNGLGNQYSNYSYFLSLYNYHQLSDELINRFTKSINAYSSKASTFENVKKFVVDNLKRFNDENINHYYSNITDNNQYNTFYYDKFPVSYQHKYLLTRPVSVVLSNLTGHRCQWTEQEKINFLKEYTAINQVS